MDPITKKRIASVRQALVEKELEALMVSVAENRYYLSGFSGEDTQFDESAGILIISADDLILATDSRYELQARVEADGYHVVCYQKGLEKELPGIAGELGIRRLGFESVRLSFKNHQAYADALRKLDPPIALVPTEDMIETLRQIKSEDEIRRTTRALRLAEKAFLQVLDTLRLGMTEKQIAWAMEKAMREAGAQSLSFPVIVASGPNSALPHAVPSDRQLARGEPDEQFRKVFDTVVTARDMATAAILAGASGTAVDKIARDHIDNNGFRGKFGHGLGHGTGLAVHERPRLSPIKDQRLEAGMIVTVEPGIYLPGWGGIRMENQVVVQQEGARVLNDPAPFDPRVEV